MRIALFAVWALAALTACDDEPGRGAPADARVPVDAVPDADADDGPADGGRPDASPPDAAPDAALPTGTPALNELDCRSPSAVELYAAEPTSLAGWRLVVGRRTLALAGIFQGFQQVELPFQLACDQAITLVDPEGTTRETATSPLLVAAWTFGRLPDGFGPWQVTAPTPGAANRLPEAPSTDLFDGALHPIQITWSFGAIEVLDREWEKDVEATVTVDGGDPRPALIRISGFDGRARPGDQKTWFKIKWLDAGPGELGGIELRPSLIDPAFLTEAVTLEMLATLGIVVPRAGFAAVEVEGADLGPFTLVEAMDSAFAERHFASTWHIWQGVRIDLPAHPREFDAVVGDAADRRDLYWFADFINNTGMLEGSAYALTADIVDWPSALNVMAAEAWLGSTEGYGPRGNFLRMHVDQSPRLTLVPDGLDVALRTPLNPQVGTSWLFATCQADLQCREAYLQALIATHHVLAAGDWATRLRARAASLRPAISADPATYWPVEMFDDASEARARFIEVRTAEIADLIECLEQTTDTDGDGFRCAADCAPDDPTRFVGAVDACGNGIDEDCSGVADDGATCPRCTEVRRGGKRYLICPQRRSYAAARDVCQGLGAQLVSIDGAGENGWLFQQANGIVRQEYWIGLDDLTLEGTFVRPDGSLPPYGPWAGGEPNDYNGVEDCAHLRTDGLWNDNNCAVTLGAICDFPCDSMDLDGDGVDGCSLDCDDTNPDILPGAVDTCGDGLDQDCSGVVDDAADCACAAALRGAHRYLLCPEALGFGQIQRVCSERGLAPLRIDSASENVFVYLAARARRYQRWWIALSDEAVEGQYRFLDGSPLRYAAWSRGEPNDSGRVEDCIHFWEDRPDWNDIGCGANGGVICEEACMAGTDGDGDGAEGCGTDCDDADGTRYPGAAEVCGDGIDQDCDGAMDEGC